MTTETNKIGQRDMKGATNDCFLFDSCFSSNKLVESEMDIGTYMIGVVKTNTEGFYKETIENITNNWPGDSYLVFRRKPMVPRFRPIIAIGYKYNTWKVIYFLDTEDTVSTNSVITYLSK